MQGTELERKRTERGVILTILVQDPSPKTAIRSLWRMLDRRGFSLSVAALEFHLQKALEPAGLVELTRAREMKGVFEDLSPDAIVFVRLTDLGLQAANGTLEHAEVELP